MLRRLFAVTGALVGVAAMAGCASQPAGPQQFVPVAHGGHIEYRLADEDRPAPYALTGEQTADKTLYEWPLNRQKGTHW